jgi:hypothetical protein
VEAPLAQPVRRTDSVSMGRGARAALLLIVLVGRPASLVAQSINPGPPGPFVFDIRGAASGLPSTPLVVPGSQGAVPTRGFGGSVGGHVYAFDLGPARIGAGVDVMVARGTAPGTQVTLWSAAPQVSVNFGTSDGWSYLSAGVGTAHVGANPGLKARVRDINYGGGARWFLTPHWGIGFDVRIHQMAAGADSGAEIPAATAVAFGVGVSVK